MKKRTAKTSEVIRETRKRFSHSRLNRLPSSKADPKALPLGLSREDLAQLQALMAEIPYKHFLQALEHLYQHNLAAILRGLPHDAYMFQCGVCYALEQIASLPADLSAKAKELDARHTAHPPESDPGAAVFANTPFWDAYQRLGKRSRQYGGPGVPLPG